MKRCAAIFISLAAIVLNSSAEDSKREVKKQADLVAAATLAGKYAVVIDHSLPKLVDLLGGRDEAIKTTAATMKKMNEQGFAITTYTNGDPGEMSKDGGNTFVVIPTRMEMSGPNVKVIVKSYLLGISADTGKTWLFADGSGMENVEIRAKVLPKLPADFKFPEKVAPEVIKTN